MPKSIMPETWRDFDEFRRQGCDVQESARRAGVSTSAAHARLAGMRFSSGNEYRLAKSDAHLPDVIPESGLSDDAKRALGDFGYFRARFFGRISSPWQEEAAHRIVDLLATPRKEWVVLNCPPGSGKSTTFTHDIPAWLACQNRAVRCLLGSRSQNQAKQYTMRVRRSMDRRIPLSADPDQVAKGLAIDAASTLIADYGRFKPSIAELWRVEEFVIAQLDDQPIEEKEPSFAAFGMDSASLGYRLNFVLWDDLVDKTVLRTAEARERQQSWFVDEAETRLEPGGLFVLQGQRMGAEDLYRFALDMRAGVAEDEAGGVTVLEGTDADSPRKYTHVVFKAHYEDRCEKVHGAKAKPYPDGCLLDPVRLPWRELATHEANNSSKYRVVYQQEDVDPANVLVNALWVSGGRGVDGIDYPGCWDRDRGACELPKGLTMPVVSVAVADPSPTKFWAIEWWVYHPDTEQRFLMDLIRQAMDAPDFLDWNYNDACFSGVMESWQQRSIDLGIPIQAWVVEENAAQRYLLQYSHVKRWQAKRGVDIIPHATHRNKSDADYGVQSIAPHWRWGRVRLPGKQFDPGRMAALKLVEEATRWPEGRYDDCVMAQWFFEWNLPHIAVPDLGATGQTWRPSWMRKEAVA